MKRKNILGLKLPALSLVIVLGFGLLGGCATSLKPVGEKIVTHPDSNIAATDLRVVSPWVPAVVVSGPSDRYYNPMGGRWERPWPIIPMTQR